jgi:uncharacterized protein (DUF1810 family)
LERSKRMSLERFIDAQAGGAFERALGELQQGRKRSHWMWFILPQLRGLGHSANSRFYGLSGLAEAKAYLAHPVLGGRLLAICDALVDWPHMGAEAVLGSVDAMKLRSCLTLFAAVPDAPPIFTALLRNYFDGTPCPDTLAAIR